MSNQDFSFFKHATNIIAVTHTKINIEEAYNNAPPNIPAFLIITYDIIFTYTHVTKYATTNRYCFLITTSALSNTYDNVQKLPPNMIINK